MRKLAAPLFIALLAAGCGGGEELLKSDTSPSFVDGYNDGCASGSASVEANPAATAVPVRNQARYNNEPDYALGWQNGQRECNGANMELNPNNPMEQTDDFGDSSW
jgi:hypothetical protein